MSFRFHGSHTVGIHGGNFYNVAGNMNITVSGPDNPQMTSHESASTRARRDEHRYDSDAIHFNRTFTTFCGNMNSNVNGLDFLYRSVLKDAIHNSADRFSDPSCHPGTRSRVLADLTAWAHDGRRESRLLWLYGSAGIGKSAVVQTFAANCEEQRLLGASFFFKRQDAERGSWKGLFPTLAYQLAISLDELRDFIREAVEGDMLVFGQAMRHQYQKLIATPFEQAPPFAVRPIIVIDGLDECEDHGVQLKLLKLLSEGIRTLPFRVLVASRPEPHLREAIQAPNNSDICRHLELRPDASAYADIRRYFCDEFSRIRHDHTSRGILLENDWPGQGPINNLVTKSSGTFIYAVTVLRYIDDEYSHPADRLGSVLSLDPQSTTPLDNLYTQILSAVPNISVLRRVLHAVIRTNEDWEPEEIDIALQLRSGTSRLVLRRLHSVVFVPPARIIGRHPVRLLHASFCDFLLDPLRSSELCIEGPELDLQLVRCMITFLSTSASDTLISSIIASSLLRAIVRVEPTDDLLPVLQNMDSVQQESFSSLACTCQIIEWLKTFCLLPLHLIQIWDDLRFICELQNPVQPQDLPSDNLDAEYDKICSHILSENPQTLSILRIISVFPSQTWWPWAAALDLLEVKWHVLRPLTAIHGHRLNGGNLSKFLIEFLQDSRRAGVLYVSPEVTRQFVALRCVSRLRQVLASGQWFRLDRKWLRMISSCDPSHAVLHELENLDVAQLCGLLHPDPEYHLTCHSDFLHPIGFEWILDWLRTFPSPPHQVIEFWERQMVAVESCRQSFIDASPRENTAPGFA
ncbi:hypothetical protein K438DRAFT_1922448 [Mycena galopus ATCC 62051]|nr:hypothetical protein K438DRAFT_1922448 [Mycena galopus ATCC 62051]